MVASRVAERIYVVVSPGMVHVAYRSSLMADSHARCVTGAIALPCEVLDRIPPEIRFDIEVDEVGAIGSDEENEWDSTDTPVDHHES